MAIVAGGQALCLLFLAYLFQALGRAEAGVGVTARDQLLGRLLVLMLPLALDVGTVGTTDVRALVAIMDAARAGRPMTAGALGAAVELSSPAVTALVDRLERVGHVERVRDEHDRRRVVLEMTPSAMAAGGEFFGGLQRDLAAAMDGYSDDELAVVRRFLEEMTEVIVSHQRAD